MICFLLDSLCCLCKLFASALAWNPLPGSVPITWPSGNPRRPGKFLTYTSNDLPASSVQSGTNAMNEWSEPGCSDSQCRPRIKYLCESNEHQ